MINDTEFVMLIFASICSIVSICSTFIIFLNRKSITRSNYESEYYYDKMRKRIIELEDRYEALMHGAEISNDKSGLSDLGNRDVIRLYERLVDEINELRHYMQRLAYDRVEIDYDEIESSIKSAISESYNSSISEMPNTLKEAAFKSELIEDYQLKISEIDAIISNVLHIIRTPISGIDISCKLIDSCNSDVEMKAESSNITGYVHMIEDGISALRSSVTTSEDSVKENVKDRIIHDCNLLRLTAPKKININYRFDDEKWFVEKNKLDYLLLCVCCILENAIYYTKDNGSIDIEALHESSGLRLNISNHGKPIDNQVIDRMFEKGFSEKNSSGNGLCIARGIAEQYLNGKIELTSNDENAVTFSIIAKES